MRTSKAVLGAVMVLMGTGCATALEEKPMLVAGPAPARVDTDRCIYLSRHGGDAVEDTRVARAWPDKSYGKEPVAFTGLVGRDQRQFLLRFGLEDVPEGADVRRANLILYRSVCGGSALSVHRVTSPWDEARTSWNSLQQQFDARPLTSVDLTCEASPSPMLIDVTPAVRDWVSGERENHGLLLRSAKASAFATSESADSEEQPVLQLCFAPRANQRLAARN